MEKCLFCGFVDKHSRICHFNDKGKTNLDKIRKNKTKNKYDDKTPFRLDGNDVNVKK